MTKYKYVFPIYIFILLGFVFSNAYAEDNKLIVTGYSTVPSVPDRAVCNIRLRVVSEEIEVVKKKYAKTRQTVTDLLKKVGINENNILFSAKNDISLEGVTYSAGYSPNYYAGNTNSSGYRATPKFQSSSSIDVIIDDLSKIELLTTAFANIQGVSLSSVNYRLKDSSKVKEQALAKAIEEAKTKAKQLARLSDIRLGKLIGIQLISIGSPRRYQSYQNINASILNDEIHASGQVVIEAAVKVEFEALVNDTPANTTKDIIQESTAPTAS